MADLARKIVSDYAGRRNVNAPDDRSSIVEKQKIIELNSKAVSSKTEALVVLGQLKGINGELFSDGILKQSIEGILGEFEIYTVESVINALENKSEPIVESKALRKDELEELERDYEKYLKEKNDEKQALEATIEENKNLGKREEIEKFIKRRQEIYKKNLEKLELQKKQNVKVEPEVIDFKETKKIKEEIKTEAEIITKEQIILENRIERSLSDVEEKKEVSQKLSERIIDEIIKPEYGSEIEEIEKLVEKYIEPEKIVEFKKEIEEIKKVAEVEIEIKKRVDESASNYVEELKLDEKLVDRVERSETEIKNKTKEILLEKIQEEMVLDKSDIYHLVDETTKIINSNGPELNSNDITPIRTASTKTCIATDNWVNTKSEEINIYKGNILSEKIESVIFSERPNLSSEEIGQVREYQKLIKEIYYPKDKLNIDQFKNESFEFALKSGAETGRVNSETWNDVKGLARIAKMTPQQFKDFSEKYKLANNVLGGKLPFSVKECGSLDRIMSEFDKNPALRKLLNTSQKLAGFYEKIGGFIPNLKMKLGLQVGGFITERIGNQAMKVFTQNAMAVIAEKGLSSGIGMILKGLITRGAITAGATVGGASVAIAAAGAAIPGVGWIIAGASLILNPILDKIKSGLQSVFGEKLGGWLGDRLRGGLNVLGALKSPALLGELGGLFGLGGAGAAATGAGAAAGTTAGAAAAGAGIAAGGWIPIVVVGVIVGIMVLGISTSSMASTLVPPKGAEEGMYYVEQPELETGGLACSFNIPSVGLSFTRNDLMSVAKSVLGLPYFWGGKYPQTGSNSEWCSSKEVWANGNWSTGRKIPYGLDCSGYVDWVYYQLTGKQISGGGGSASIFRNTDPISEAELKPGDLGFIGDKGSSHVAMFIGRDSDGKALFIQAVGRSYAMEGRPAGRVIILKVGGSYGGYNSQHFDDYRRPHVIFNE